MLGTTDRLWVIHISKPRRVVQRAKDEGFICIGWPKLGDLAQYNSMDSVREALTRADPHRSAASVRSSFGQIYKFAHEMEVGDAVVYPVKSSRNILIGRVVGEYEWSSDPELMENDCRNLRRVQWLADVPRLRFTQGALRSFGSFSTLSRSDEHLAEVRAALAGQDLPETAKSSAAVTEEDEVAESETDAASAAEEVVQATKDYLLRHWVRTNQDFEEVVAGIFRAMGYTAITQQGTRDLGVDVIAHTDPIGVTPPILKIQVKSGLSTVGAREVKQLRGVLNSGEKGVVVGLGGFSADARHTEQNDANLVLIDADRIVNLFLTNYDRLSPEMRHRFPLRQVYVVAD